MRRWSRDYGVTSHNTWGLLSGSGTGGCPGFGLLMFFLKGGELENL